MDLLNNLCYTEQRWPGITESPLFIFYDQEPILGKFNFELFDYIRDNFHGPFILVTTEKNSDPLNEIQQRYNWPTVYYFHHVFAAHDWFRGVRYDSRLIAPSERKLKKKYISFNRLTSSKRVYRSLFISELIQRNILDQGYVSYNDVCPENNKDYVNNLLEAQQSGLIGKDVMIEVAGNIAQVSLPLRIDYKDTVSIPNHSFILSAVPESQESFVYVVTETCYWERKCHLTEKIFKPIVSRMPFILVGPVRSLEYLRSYGFKTFTDFWDESYDTIEDPIERMRAIGAVLQEISNCSLAELQDKLVAMNHILEHNYNLFNSQAFVDGCWQELKTNLVNAVAPK